MNIRKNALEGLQTHVIDFNVGLHNDKVNRKIRNQVDLNTHLIPTVAWELEGLGRIEHTRLFSSILPKISASPARIFIECAII